MSKRVFNFNPGPAILPEDVLQKAAQAVVEFNNLGMGILEISHRSKDFEAVITDAEAKVRKILGLPDTYHVLFLQGGASMQFGMVPMNLLKGGKADYVHTGEWAKKAIKEAKLFGTVNVAATSEDKNFNYIPDKFNFSADAQYVHVTSNETIGGIQWTQFPQTGNVPMIVDMSSDIFSRRLDYGRFAMIYAGAQKNAGPAGVTLVIIRKDLVEAAADNVTTMLSYKTHAKEKSLYNTPPCFSIYVVKLVLDWIEARGGLAAVEAANEKKAKAIYDAFDGDFYRGTANPKDRSKMNITFRLPSEALEEQFIAEAKKAGFVGLKGHRSVGGCRASVYNAFPVEGAEKLVGFMKEFRKKS